jgi:CRISPR/Cas system endoribonuclease Cas6 (RAMP superfamily)
MTGLSDMTLKTEISVSQQVWHVKEFSLLKAVSAEHKSKFAVLSPIMVKAAR